MTPGGLPHSGIRGSTPADGYPRLIAAFHALLRLVAPRHPPCALNSSAPRDAPCRANRIELNQLLVYIVVTGYVLQPPDALSAPCARSSRPPFLMSVTLYALVKVHSSRPIRARCLLLGQKKPTRHREADRPAANTGMVRRL